MVPYKYLVNKNKKRIMNTSNTKNIILQDSPKVLLSDKIDSITNKINRIINEVNDDSISVDTQPAISDKKYKKCTIVKDNNKNLI